MFGYFSRSGRTRYTTNYVAAMSGLGLGLLIVVSIFSYWSAQRFLDSDQWKTHSADVRHVINELQVYSERAETGQRGFLLTGQERFLEPYIEAKNQVVSRIAHLESLVDDNSVQEAHAHQVGILIRKRLEHLEFGINQARGGKAAEAIKDLRTGTGKAEIDAIRRVLKDMLAEEERLLESRTIVADQDFKRASLVVVGGLFFSFLVLGAVLVLLRAEVKRRSLIQRSLEIAERKAIEASDMKSMFLANMSHELRTPLNGIIGMAKLLSDTKLDEEQGDFVETIRDSSVFLFSLINQILDISKIESGKLQLEEVHFELRSLLQSTRAMVLSVADAKGIKITVAIADDVPDHFLGDPLRLRQILLNLINNAVKFSNEGEIAVRVVKSAQQDASKTSCLRLSLSVRDQGIGFDQDTRSKLFKAFAQGDESTTRRFGGTGLGLAISKELVEMMGGHIDVESSVGEGSKFFFDIELKAAKYERLLGENEARAKALTNSNQEAASSYRILIAEDNLTNQKVASAILKRLGYRFEIAANGADAIEALKKTSFDLVLMDGQMPVMDGYQATRAIRQGAALEKNKNIPIIAVTANAIKGDLEICLLAGMNDYTAKPILIEDLKIKIEKWLTAGSALAKHGVETGVIQKFALAADRSIHALRTAVANGSLDELRVAAHSIRGAASELGAIRAKEIAQAIEKTTNLDDVAQLQEMIERLEGECEASIEELKRYAAA